MRARLLEVFPVLPLIFRTPLAVGALSYAGQFNLSAIADPDACPDLDVFATAARDELRALADSTLPPDDRTGRHRHGPGAVPARLTELADVRHRRPR